MNSRQSAPPPTLPQVSIFAEALRHHSDLRVVSAEGTVLEVERDGAVYGIQLDPRGRFCCIALLVPLPPGHSSDALRRSVNMANASVRLGTAYLSPRRELCLEHRLSAVLFEAAVARMPSLLDALAALRDTVFEGLPTSCRAREERRSGHQEDGHRQG